MPLPPALTLQQQRAISAAGRLAPNPSWGDGIMRNICDRFDGDGPWSNSEVNAAISTVIADAGLDFPVLPEGTP
jgi:hypothetical protein